MGRTGWVAGVWLAAGCAASATGPAFVAPTYPLPLTVTVLDVGQGDAIWIENGRSKVLIDAGESTARMAVFIAEQRLAGDTIDLVILTHAHFDHHGGMRELFKSAYGITIRRFYENQDPAPGVALAELRDSVAARAARGQLELRDTDDPCGDGRPVCTHILAGGAVLHLLKPLSAGSTNDRSAAVKLVGPDSASFTMWLSGDAEHAAMAFFEAAYAASPGLNVRVLKGNHHGSCNGTTPRFLDLTSPEWVTFGVGATNSFGHVHEQTKALLRARGIRWLRSDVNGRVVFRTSGLPLAGYSVTIERGEHSADGSSDRAGAAQTCGP